MYFDDEYGTDARKLWVKDETNGFSESGETHDYTFNTGESTTEPIKIVLSYSDYPASPAAGTPGVNDLDLIVEVNDQIYLGNVFGDSGARSIVGGSRDQINRDEVVWLDAMPGTSVIVTVSAAAIRTSTQPYALVISGDIYEGIPNNRPSAPVLTNKLFDNERLYDRRPVAGWHVPSDLDGQPLDFVFEYAYDDNFIDIIESYSTALGDPGFFGASFPTVEGSDFIVSFQFVDDLEPDSTYWWHVRAYDGVSYGPWSEKRSFTINNMDTTPDWFQTTSCQFEGNDSVNGYTADDQVSVVGSYYYIDEDFNYEDIGAFEAEWTSYGSYYTLDESKYHSPGKSLRIYDNSRYARSSVNHSLPNLAHGTISGWVYTENVSDESFIIALYDASVNRVTQLYFRENYIALWDGSTRNNLMAIPAGGWHLYEMTFNCPGNTIYVTVDSTYNFGPYSFVGGALDYVNVLAIGTLSFNEYTCDTYYDDYIVSQRGPSYGYMMSTPIAFNWGKNPQKWNNVIWNQDIGDSIIIFVDYNVAGIWNTYASAICNEFASAGTLDTQGLDRIDTLRLRAELETKDDNLPNLYDWSVSWLPFPLNVDENAANIPDQRYISLAPNPFNAVLRITAPEGADVTIFDTNGRMIRSLNGSEGTFFWQPNDSNTSGVYLVKSVINNEVRLDKVIYLK